MVSGLGLGEGVTCGWPTTGWCGTKHALAGFWQHLWQQKNLPYAVIQPQGLWTRSCSCLARAEGFYPPKVVCRECLPRCGGDAH